MKRDGDSRKRERGTEKIKQEISRKIRKGIKKGAEERRRRKSGTGLRRGFTTTSRKRDGRKI